MGRYVLKRLLLLIPVIIGVSLIIFIAMNVAQGDYVDTLNLDNLTDVQIAQLRAKYNLDKPLMVQYFDYMKNFFRGDLGVSWNNGQKVLDVYFQKLPNTLYLALMCTLIGTLLSIPLGIFSARHAGSLWDNLASVLAIFSLSAPSFWFGLLLMLLFSLKLGWLPSQGNEVWYAVLMPAFTLGTERMASLTRTTRSSMLDTLSQDYLRTARAKGVPERTVVNKHALKPALIPIVNIAMSQFSGAMTGAALTESVFSWPGVGRLVVESVRSRDIPMSCGFLLMTCIIVCIVDMASDLIYVAVDPRLRTHYAASNKKRRKKANV